MEVKKHNYNFSNIKAILFDMDGLMIDSEPLQRLAYNNLLLKHGYHLSEKENISFGYVGISDKVIAPDLIKRFHLKMSAQSLIENKRSEYIKLLVNIKAQAGLSELLKYLHKTNYKKAIASSAPIKEILCVVKSLNITDYFDAYCSTDEVKHSKPSPDTFLLAAKKLSVQPNECLVLEDTNSGIKAANNAQMLSIAIPSNETKAQDFKNATLKLKSLKEVINYL